MIIWTLWTCLNVWFFLSQQPPPLRINLNIYIGGWAPYYSILGIEISSIAYKNNFPGGGISITLPDFLWLDNFDYSWSWAIFGEVWAVNVKCKLDIPYFFDTFCNIDVFPVPVGPKRKIGSFFSIKNFVIYE